MRYCRTSTFRKNSSNTATYVRVLSWHPAFFPCFGLATAHFSPNAQARKDAAYDGPLETSNKNPAEISRTLKDESSHFSHPEIPAPAVSQAAMAAGDKHGVLVLKHQSHQFCMPWPHCSSPNVPVAQVLCCMTLRHLPRTQRSLQRQ